MREKTPPNTLFTIPPDEPSIGVVGSSDEATLVKGEEGSVGLPAIVAGGDAVDDVILSPSRGDDGVIEWCC